MASDKPASGWFQQSVIDAIEHELVETYINGDEGWERIVSMVAEHSGQQGHGMEHETVFETLAPAREAFHSKFLGALRQMDVDMVIEDPA